MNAMIGRRLRPLKKAANKLIWDARRRRYGAPPVRTLFEAPNERYTDTWPATEWVRFVPGPVYIEPEFGYAFTPRGVLIEDSLALQVNYGRPAWRLGLPDPAPLLRRIRRHGRAGDPRTSADPYLVTVRNAVSLRHFWEFNYYHFHLDVLGKLALLAQAGVPSVYPLILGRYVRQLPFAAQLLEMGGLARRAWIVPDLEDRTLIRAEEGLYFCRTVRPYRERVDPLLDEMGVSPVGGSGSPKRRRVFLTRRPPATRALANADEIETLLRRRGFEVLDTARGITIPEQIALFSEVDTLVALHGAGLTNVIYRRGRPLSVIELHGEGYVTADMGNLCKEYGFRHARVGGRVAEHSHDPQHADYRIEPDELERCLDRMAAAAR